MELKDFRLLAIANRFPHIKDSISESFVKEQVDALSKCFEKVTVIALTPYVPKFLSKFSFMNPRWGRDAFASDYNYDNVEVYFATHFTLPFNSSREKRGDVAFKVVTKLIEKEKVEFDLIHAHFTYPSSYVAAKLKKNYGKPLIITAHGYDVYDLPFRNADWNKKIRTALSAADHVITPSKSNYAKLMQLDIPDEKVTVIHNGYDPNLFKIISMNKAKKKLNLPEDKKVILSVGNLELIKGHKYLIEAIKEEVKRGKNITCLIAGSGSQKKYLNRIIGRLSLRDNVKLVGGKPHNELPLWLNACDVFVLPSLRESFGIVQIEAMACGKPVVATFNGGSEEVILNEKLGLLVEPKDATGLAKAILKALDTEWDKEYILSYAEQYSWDAIIRKIIKVYNELLEKK